MIYLEEQLQLIRTVQEWMGCHEAVLCAFSFFDSHGFYFMVLTFVWVGISWRWGVRLGGLLLVSGMVNRAAKILCDLPRPFHYDPTLGLAEAGSYGFPSGAAQTAMIFGFFLIYAWKNRWAWPCAILYVLAISATRILLGVHFVVDLIGGWALGLLVAGVFVLAIRPLERISSRKPAAMLSTILAIALLGLAVLPAKFDARLIAISTGSLGVYLSTKYGLYLSHPRPVHGLLASAGAFLLYVSFSGEMFSALIAAWISLVASLLFKSRRTSQPK